MKKALKFIVMFFIICLVTGCVRAEVTMGITDDGKVTVTFLSAINMTGLEEYMEGEDGDYLNTDNEMFTELGYTVSEYSDEEGYKGVTAVKSYNLDKVAGTSPVTVDLSSLSDGEWDKQLFQKIGNDKYKGSFTFGTTEELDEQMAPYASSFSISYAVTLPTKALSHNADEVKGNTLIWKIGYGKIANIEYEFSLKGGSTNTGDDTAVIGTGSNKKTSSSSDNFIWYIIGGAVGVILVGTVLILILKRKKPKAIVQPEPVIAPETAEPVEQNNVLESEVKEKTEEEKTE